MRKNTSEFYDAWQKHASLCVCERNIRGDARKFNRQKRHLLEQFVIILYFYDYLFLLVLFVSVRVKEEGAINVTM